MAKNLTNTSSNSPGCRSSITAETKSSSTVTTSDAIGQLQSLMGRGKVPTYVKQVMELLIETREEMKEISRRNSELLKEVHLLREENRSLREKLANFERQSSAAVTDQLRSQSAPVLSTDDHERERSIVLLHVPESASSVPSERLAHDFAKVVELLNCLNIECTPLSVYRMGRPVQDRPRLIKVVLPCSRFQRLALRRAHRLRFSPTLRGTFVRPSLTWEERMRRREQRLSRGGLGNDTSLRATQARDGFRSPVPSANETVSSTPHNRIPSENY